MSCCCGGKKSYICSFCAIKLQSKQVLVATDQCFIINDKRPRAFIHLLVIPRQHVQGLDDQLLTLDLLEDMYSLALVTLESMYPAGTYKIGFRPADSKKHLHLHAFVPPHRPWWRRWRYKGEKWMPVETVLEGLKARQRGSSCNNGGEEL